MNQQPSHKNSQQYAPQYPPQYDQQTGQYQVAPSGSQYVAQPPSQQAMLPGFWQGPDGLNQRQRLPNPCICFKCCSSGTCSLRNGCYVIGILCLLGGLLIGGFEAAIDFYMWQRFRFHHYQDGLVYSDTVFFNVLPGAFLLVGAWSLDPACCIVAAIFLVLGGVYGFFWLIFIGYQILTRVSRLTHGDPLYIAPGAVILIVVVISCLALRSYYAYCATALVLQIRNGEYKLAQPQPSIIVQQILTSAPSATYTARPDGSNMPVQVSNN